MQLTADSVLVRSNNIVSSEIDGETLMMDSNFDKYFGLKEVGTHIWRMLEQKLSVRDICEGLTDEFDVSYDQCLDDILPFLQDLHEQGMIEIQQ